MAIVVEDGTGKADAVAMASAATADAYFTARAITAWTGTTTAKEAALIRGWQYVENAYRGRWKGSRTHREQSLAWPRMSGVTFGDDLSGAIYDQDGHFIESDEIPQQVVDANCEAALLVVQGVDLEPRLARGGAVRRKKVKAGPVESETEYADSASARDRITVIEGLLSGLVTSAPGASFGNLPVVRA